MTILADILLWFDLRLENSLAADWDNTGLLLGDPAIGVAKALTCLSLTKDVAGEAITNGCNLIVTHHPLPFKPLKEITTKTLEGEILWRLAGKGIAVYSPHTRWDNAKGGINESLGAMFGLTSMAPLVTLSGYREIKVTTFVPKENVEALAAAMFQAGAGVIGNYRECSFRLPGTGTFFGEDAASPVVGQKGRREFVSEERLEMVCPEEKLPEVVQALRKNHPYEEPAFDLFLLQGKTLPRGEGVVGDLPPGSTLSSVAKLGKSALGLATAALVGNPGQQVTRAAIVCGSGGSFLPAALRAGANLFITGEMRFHDCLEARERGLGVLLLGHYASEKFGMEILAQQLSLAFPNIQTVSSNVETDPVNYLA
ncbi:MAG: Nif3-like dinuclear metal center hexameric protein [Gemmataceae bacterium]|nr:Nif3-like dinuclear metal center hexameric protein [Gemmataceae bacterium]